MGNNCFCCETSTAEKRRPPSSTRSRRYESSRYESQNKMWIKELTKKIVSDIVKEIVIKDSKITPIKEVITPNKKIITNQEIIIDDETI